MSLIISSAARLKPEVRLAQAVSEFEAALSDNQKVLFRDDKANSIKHPPSPNDVMRLTAQLSHSQNVGRRCFGPRFTKFLHGTQQFAALGDVVIGGSQNIIACSVWSLVRMTLLGTVNYCSYIESLSLLLMEVGRSTPQHLELAILYPRSTVLQSYILEYFIVVVQLCQKFLSFMQKSTFRKFASSISDADLQEFRLKLLSSSKSIRDEIDPLVAHRTEEEAQNNSKFRALMARVSKTATRQQRLNASQKVLDSCSMYDFESTWRQVRKIGTTTLFTNIPEYKQWKKGLDSSTASACTLLIKGKLGAGKSVTLANMIDDLLEQDEFQSSTLSTFPGQRNSDAIVVAYFFCKHNIPESLQARTVIGAIIRQLLQPYIDAIENLDVPNGPSNYEHMSLLLRQIKPDKDRIYVILDGLDLCDKTEAEIIVAQLHVLQSLCSMKLCISYRLDSDSLLDTMRRRLFATIVTSLPNNTVEIEAFIEAELGRCLENRSLMLGDPALILEIQDALSKGSQGMFLWVALQIRSLCTMQTDAEIREALTDLPRDLPQIYQRTLQQSDRISGIYRSRIFELVLAAKRPLTVDEMREALSVTPGDTVWTASKLLHDVYSVIATCGGLIAVEEEDHTLHTIHPSVDQFLWEIAVSDTGSRSFKDMQIKFTRALMVDIILTYLSYGVFGTELTVRLPDVDMGAAPAKILNSTMSTSKAIPSIALKLLRSRKQPKFDASRIIAEGLHAQKSEKAIEFPFYCYAKRFALRHLLDLRHISAEHYENVLKLLRREIISISTQKEAFQLLAFAMQHGILHAMDFLIPWAINADPLEFAGYDNTLQIGGLFYPAIEKGQLDVVKRFVDVRSRCERRGNFQSCRSPYGSAPITFAIAQHRNAILEYLMFSGVYLCTDVVPDLLMKAAIEARNHEALEFLLSAYVLEIALNANDLWKSLESLVKFATRIEDRISVKLLTASIDHARNPPSPGGSMEVHYQPEYHSRPSTPRAEVEEPEIKDTTAWRV